MCTSKYGKAAQLLYADEQPLSFVRVVEELRCALTQTDDPELVPEWDGSNFAIFDLYAVRIVLGASERPREGYFACLTVAVEPSPHGSQLGASDGYEETCSKVVEYLNRHYPALVTLWFYTNEPLTSSLHDRLPEGVPLLTRMLDVKAPDRSVEAKANASEFLEWAIELDEAELVSEPTENNSAALGRLAPELEANRSITHGKYTQLVNQKSLIRSPSATARARASRARARGKAYATAAKAPMPASEVVNGRPSPSELFDVEFARVRAALKPTEPEQPAPRLSSPLRLSAHALNATLILVWLPLGAAVMTYTLLKGENLLVSSRLMVLTGLFVSALDTPLAQHIAAMVGV